MTSHPDIKQELKMNRDSLRNRYFSVTTDLYTLKTDTLRGNTARAFQRGKCYNRYTPSSILKYWLHHHYFGSPDVVKMLKYETDFEQIHQDAIKDLRRFWLKTEPEITKMDFYYFAKIVDLLFKSLTRWDELSAKRKEWYFNNAHVPLDKYSLAVLNRFHSDYNISSPSMNYVGNSPKLYATIQKDIRDMVSPHPPMLFDLYAWDHWRPKQLELREKFELQQAPAPKVGKKK